MNQNDLNKLEEVFSKIEDLILFLNNEVDDIEHHCEFKEAEHALDMLYDMINAWKGDIYVY